MTTINTQYSIGDKVFFAYTNTEQKKHSCPDCFDSREWSAVSPAGGSYDIPCPRCAGGYTSSRAICLTYKAHVGAVKPLTIGSVRFDSHEGKATYMCVETGVGSGSIYDEKALFMDESAALESAKVMAIKRNSETPSLVEQYQGSLAFADYQFSNAIVKEGRDMVRLAHDRTQTLFDDLGDCETVEDFRTVVRAWADQ